jgi:hypothetical protein
VLAHTTSPMPIGFPATTTVPPVYVRTRQASQITGIAEGTLNNWRSQGRGPAFHKIGRTVLYDLAELHRVINAGRVETSAA